jgi:predicted dehydrogenase
MVMRRDAAKCRDYARRHDVPRWTTDADALIGDPAIDAVYIATPPHLHLPYALKVAAAGKIAYVEKPMALDADQGRQMVAAFDRTPLFVAYYRRSLPRFTQIRDWLTAGRIGLLRHVHWSLARPPKPADLSPDNWRVRPAMAGGGYFVDLACHGLDLLLHLAGDIDDVHGVTRNQQGRYDAEDAVAAAWAFASGATGSAFWNFAAGEIEDAVTLYGERGRIDFSIFDDHPIRLRSGGEDASLTVPHPENIQLPHIAAIRRHLDGDAVHPSLGVEAVKVSVLMDRILSGG